jgi:hypothetical protein
MTVNIQPLIQSHTLSNAYVSLFTASAPTRIDAVTLFNPTGNASETVTIEWVPTGGSTGAGNLIASYTLLGGNSATVYELIGQVMAAGDQIYAKGATGALVNMFASGTVVT